MYTDNTKTTIPPRLANLFCTEATNIYYICMLARVSTFLAHNKQFGHVTRGRQISVLTRSSSLHYMYQMMMFRAWFNKSLVNAQLPRGGQGHTVIRPPSSLPGASAYPFIRLLSVKPVITLECKALPAPQAGHLRPRLTNACNNVGRLNTLRTSPFIQVYF